MTTETLTKKVLALALTIAALAAGQNAAAQVGTFTVTNTSGSTFTVTRTSNTDATEKVMYRTVSLSAIAGTHFTAASGTLTFDAEHNTRTVTVEEKTPTADAYKYQTAASRQYRFEVTDLGGTVLASKDRSITSGLTQFSGAKVSSSITNLVTFSGSNFSSGLSSGKYLDVSYTPPTSQVETSGTLSGYVLIDDSYDYAQKPATVKNVTLAGSTIIGRDEVGGIVGYSFVGTFENCRVLSDVTIKADASGADYHGGIVGYIFGRGTVNGCYSAATVTRDGNSNCTNYGGIVGKTNGTVSKCIADGAWVIGSEESSSGAIVGTNDGGTLAHNYYYGCSVKSFGNNVGTGSGDVTENDGAVRTDGIPLLDNYSNDFVLRHYADGSPHDFTLAGRTLYRDGDWNTLCLPFPLVLASSALDGTDVRTLSSSEFSNGTLTLNFTDQGAVTTLATGKPYIIKWTAAADIVNPTFTDVTISNVTANVETTYADFLGTYAPINFTEDDNTKLFVGAANKLYYPKSGAHIGAFRAYFQLGNGLTAGDPASNAPIQNFVLNLGDGDAMGIGSLSPDPSPSRERSAGAWYSPDGRKLQGKPTAKGMYIHNGYKVIIK